MCSSDLPPGPGIPESLGWIFGVLVLQTIGGLIVLVVAFFVEAATGDPQELSQKLQNPKELQRFLQRLMQDWIVALFCTTQVVFLLGTLAAATLRLGKKRSQFLPLKAVPIPHGIIIGLLIIPLMMFGESLFRFATEYWELFVTFFPDLKGLSEISSMDQIADLATQTSLPLLLLLVAFVPAVAEELVFRGVIGRGLVARWGLPVGVLMTSVMFAAVHVHPVHAFALMPLAICIHLSYLSTRSFWAPMAIHFVNNAVGVVIIYSMRDQLEEIEQAAQTEPSLLIFLAAGLCVVSLSALFWLMRVQFFLPYGTLWDPGYEGADVPPAELTAEKRYAWPDLRLLVTVAVSGMLLIAAALYVFASELADTV